MSCPECPVYGWPPEPNQITLWPSWHSATSHCCLASSSAKMRSLPLSPDPSLMCHHGATPTAEMPAFATTKYTSSACKLTQESAVAPLRWPLQGCCQPWTDLQSTPQHTPYTAISKDCLKSHWHVVPLNYAPVPGMWLFQAAWKPIILTINTWSYDHLTN